MIAQRFEYLSGALAVREQAHRRTTTLAIGLLLALGTGPAYVHHLTAIGGEQLLAGIDHVGALCITALHLLLIPVHRVFHVVIAAGVVYAVLDRVRAWRMQRRTLEVLDQWVPTVGDPFWRAAAKAGADPRWLRVVPGLPSPAFTAGLLSPQVYLAEELAVRLTPEQLAAVVAHEAAHVRRRDPLRMFLLRLLACTLFWIPAVRRLTDDMRDEAEIRADDAASLGEPLILASAILALADWAAAQRGTQASAFGVGFHRDMLLERRVRRLAGEESPVRSHVTRRSIAAAACALLVVWLSGMVMAHPLPASGHSAGSTPHCRHHEESALGHLFCLGSPFSRVADGECPHLSHQVAQGR